jgi:hypothetical protein
MTCFVNPARARTGNQASLRLSPRMHKKPGRLMTRRAGTP